MDPGTNDVREWIVAGAAVAAAFGTVGAVVYALFRDTILASRKKPKLSLTFDPVWSESNLDLVAVASPESYWARMRVANEAGRQSAQDVEVLLSRVQPLGQDERYEAPLDTRPLIWSNLIDPAGGPATQVHLPPGVTRYVDLFSFTPPMVSDGGGGARRAGPGEKAVFAPALEVHPKPSDHRHQLGTGHYRLELVVTARDVDAVAYETEIEFDGVWREPPEIWRHMKITELVTLN